MYKRKKKIVFCKKVLEISYKHECYGKLAVHTVNLNHRRKFDWMTMERSRNGLKTSFYIFFENFSLNS